ncbi:MAG: HGGxSTG domain-containing protein [Xanthobacteraceae bacterium]
MLASPRCGAKTRSGKPCMSPAVRGKKRCRMHGGARGSGAPKGNQNAVKRGHYRSEAIKQRALLREFIKSAAKAASDVNKSLDEAEERRRK